MNQAQEDALIDRVYSDWIAECDSGAKKVADLVRLAIRAAVAQERERAARESVDPLVDGWPLYSCIPPPSDIAALADGFGDPGTLWNSRKWLQAAVEAKGAKMIGGGMGCGQADIDIELEGHRFNLSLRPIAAAIRRG